MERKKRSKGSLWEFCYANKIFGTFGDEIKSCGQKLVKFCAHTHAAQLVVEILQTAQLWANTGVVFRELSFSRLECGVHDRLHIYPLYGIFYFPWHRHQIEGTNGFYCLIRKTERFTISNVESQVFTPNNSRLDPGSNPGCPRDKRMSYHWTNCASLSWGGRSACGPLWLCHGKRTLV